MSEAIPRYLTDVTGQNVDDNTITLKREYYDDLLATIEQQGKRIEEIEAENARLKARMNRSVRRAKDKGQEGE